MKRLLMLTFIAASLWAAPPTTETMGTVTYSAASYNGGGMFPWYTQIQVNSTDTTAAAFRITTEFADGHTDRQVGSGSFLVLGKWDDVTRFTVEVLKVGQIVQAQ